MSVIQHRTVQRLVAAGVATLTLTFGIGSAAAFAKPHVCPTQSSTGECSEDDDMEGMPTPEPTTKAPQPTSTTKAPQPTKSTTKAPQPPSTTKDNDPSDPSNPDAGDTRVVVHNVHHHSIKPASSVKPIRATTASPKRTLAPMALEAACPPALAAEKESYPWWLILVSAGALTGLIELLLWRHRAKARTREEEILDEEDEDDESDEDDADN